MAKKKEPKKLWRCKVIRHQVWYFDNIEAETEEQAKDLADKQACDTHPNDDYSYDTEVEEK